jgi:AbrB family looped-hinge helix DNA binding protein
MPLSRISRKSQVTIPAELRRRAGIELGDPIMVHEEDGRIIISKAEPGAWLERMKAFRGDRWLTAADQLRREREEWDRRY